MGGIEDQVLIESWEALSQNRHTFFLHTNVDETQTKVGRKPRCLLRAPRLSSFTIGLEPFWKALKKPANDPLKGLIRPCQTPSRGFLGSERLPKTSGGAFYECRTGFDPNLEGGSKHRFDSNPQQVRNTKFDPNVTVMGNDHRRHSIRT